MNAPLQKIKVVELAAVLAGPTVGQFFAELGAEVLKIEAPGGDVTRSWRLPNEQVDAGRSAYFCAANYGKSSRILDLKNNQDRLQLLDILATTDVLLTSYKPGDAAKFGLEVTELQKKFPHLIIGEISGYGSSDPRVGYDAIVQAEAGFTYLNGNHAGDFHKMPVALVDLLAAHQLKQGLLLALLERQQTGRGQVVQVNLLDAAISSLANQATNFLVGKQIPQPMGSDHPNIVPYGSIYHSQDGQAVVIAVGTDKQFALLCQLLKIAVPAEWTTNAQRVLHRNAIHAQLQAAIALQQADAFLQSCHALQIPCGRVNQMDEVMRLAEARGLVWHADGLSGLRTAIFQNKKLDLPAPPPL